MCVFLLLLIVAVVGSRSIRIIIGINSMTVRNLRLTLF